MISRRKNTTARTGRRQILIGATFFLVAWPLRAIAASSDMTVTKDPNCGCCNGWVDHLKKAGFSVRVIDTDDFSAMKARLGVPPGLAACHTAQIAGYVIEGHVPALAIRRLLIERPRAKGLAVPGMPVGSPGMEIEGTATEKYDVMLFGTFGQRPFASFRGSVELESKNP